MIDRVLYGNNPNGYTQQEIDHGHIEYDEKLVCESLWGCAIGLWSRRESTFGEGKGAKADLFVDMGVESEHCGFEITMPDGSHYHVTVQQVLGPSWNSSKL